MESRLLLVAIVVLLLVGCVPSRAIGADPAARGAFEVGYVNRTFSRVLTNGQTWQLLTDIWYPARAGQDLVAWPDFQAAPNAMPDTTARHPLIIFSHGYGSGRASSIRLLTHLARHGFVVAAPQHNDCAVTPCQSVPAPRDPSTAEQGQRRIEDITAVLDGLNALDAGDDDILTGLIDPDRVGLAGQSFGGWTTLQVLQRDARFRAGLAMSPAVNNQPRLDPMAVHSPTMVMLGELDPLVPAVLQKRFFQQMSSASDRFMVDVPQAGHEFLDACIDSLVAVPCSSALGQNELNQIMASVGTAFLLRYVAGQPYAGPLIERGGKDYTLLRASAGATPGALPTAAAIPWPTSAVPAPTPAAAPGTTILSTPSLDTQAGDARAYSSGYDGSEYVIRSPSAAPSGIPFPAHASIALPGRYADASVSADVRLVEPGDDQYVDLACRSQGGSAEYRLIVSPGQHAFGLFRWVYNTMLLLDVGTPATIRSGNESNHVELRCAGARIEARINDSLVASLEDTSFGPGELRIGAGHYSPLAPTANLPLGKPITARFVNIVVTQR